MKTLEKQTIGEFVAQDFRTASLFSKYKIDFCCKGNRTLDDVCQSKGLDIDLIEEELNTILESKDSNSIDFKSWPTDLLIDYIEKTHHRYVEEKSIALILYLDKLCKVHGERHPELFEIALHFKTCAGELAQHMKKEELILFPYVKKMYFAVRDKTAIEQPHFGTVNNPITIMQDEHENEGDRFVKIAALTNDYNPPVDSCQTYKVTFAMLKEFEQDLHKHIHLENNILFPKALALEAQLK